VLLSARINEPDPYFRFYTISVADGLMPKPGKNVNQPMYFAFA